MEFAMPLQPAPGLILAAPRSGGGKTTVSLGLLAAFTAAGLRVQPFKCGPDYIDPAFHSAAAGRPSFNLDSWAMRRGTVMQLIAGQAAGADLALCEGVMGLFDGVATPGAWGTGATADLAAATGWPVVLVLDVSGQAQTVAAVALGCATLRPELRIAGVILNRVGSERHRKLAAGALEKAGFKLLGALPRRDEISLPERHLGLVQAGETEGLQAKLSAIGAFVAEHVDLAAIRALARESLDQENTTNISAIHPPAQRIALAKDEAFSFMYPHLLAAWRAAGAELAPFSPLADERPDPSAGAVWLPGGYPELHAGKIAAASTFLNGLRKAASTGAVVHGECGGFMVLGDGLTDASGARHAMAGLLALETSYAKRKLHLGYRQATLAADCAIGQRGDLVRGHEFHYSSVISLADQPLAAITDAEGTPQPERGARRGSVSGSFFHFVDKSD
jgi:cobyrinic acid a,c-diamide synthase